jgi:hypothetical protein
MLFRLFFDSQGLLKNVKSQGNTRAREPLMLKSRCECKRQGFAACDKVDSMTAYRNQILGASMAS